MGFGRSKFVGSMIDQASSSNVKGNKKPSADYVTIDDNEERSHRDYSFPSA